MPRLRKQSPDLRGHPDEIDLVVDIEDMDPLEKMILEDPFFMME